MSETVIRVENASKFYRLGLIGGGTLRADVERWWHRLRGRNPDEHMGVVEPRPPNGTALPGAGAGAPASDGAGDGCIWALRDVSFEVKQGEILGIIGRNGAGKSTLLKLLSRVTAPTGGEIKIKGRIASLLEVGTGFHPELTGRENTYLNGAILGMTRAEVRRKFDEIVAFAEIEKFIDTPVKRYSSGMYVRLAFAVAAHLEPEILIVDEVLAVGDAEFQKKCLGKMGEAAHGGRTVLFVSHNMPAISSLCGRVLWINQGRILRDGEPRPVVHQYLSCADQASAESLELAALKRPFDLEPKLVMDRLEWLSGLPLKHGEGFRARVSVQVNSDVEQATMGLGFSTIEGTRLLTYETDFQNLHRPNFNAGKRYAAEVSVEHLPLAPGFYMVDVGSRSGDNYCLDYLPSVMKVDVIPGPKTPPYIIRQGAGVRLTSEWQWAEL